MKKNNDKKLKKILDNYQLSAGDREEFIKIIGPIYQHEEFQRRMGPEFFHHGMVTLGEHIIEDAVVTYIIGIKYLVKHQNANFSIEIAVIIAMLHDLYTIPWQNNKDDKTHKFFNKHGFRHPIEAVINASFWYPLLFEDLNDAKKIIDGIVHHMYPLPVVSFKNDSRNLLELKNDSLVEELPIHVKNILIKSTCRFKVGRISVCRSRYIEGRIVARADKYVSIRQIKNVSSGVALLTGKNKSLNKK